MKIILDFPKNANINYLILKKKKKENSLIALLTKVIITNTYNDKVICLVMADFVLSSLYTWFLIFITTLQGRCCSLQFTGKKIELFPKFATMNNLTMNIFKVYLCR